MRLIQEAARAAERTPAERNRYVDLLRVGAIAMVVVGHWLVIDVDLSSDRPSGASVLDRLEWARWSTWGFQVIPAFFLVGGFANTVSWSRHAGDGGRWASWLRRRALRLLWPTAIFVGFGAAAFASADLVGVAPGVLDQAAWAVAFILWFLSVYLVVASLTPVWVRSYDAVGPASVAALALGAVAVDALRFRLGWEMIGYLNYLLVWGAFHQMGVAWRDGWLRRGRRAMWIAAASGASLLALVAAGAYPASMVTVPGAAVQNAAPPTVALLAYGLAQAGILVALEPSVKGWLHRERAWRAVVLGNSVVMSIFLWHVVAVVLVAVILDAASVSLPGPIGSAAWLAFRPVWVAMLAAALFALVLVVARLERPPGGLDRALGQAPSNPLRLTAALFGVGAASAGLALLALEGLWPVGGGRGPVLGLTTFAIGCALLLGTGLGGRGTVPEE